MFQQLEQGLTIENFSAIMGRPFSTLDELGATT
jgi:hypothetical protein